jgi:hypothetical protein
LERTPKEIALRRFVVTIGLCLLAARAFGSPPEAVAAALAHARTLGPDANRQLRYLDLSTIAPEQRGDATRVLSFLLNSLSRESDIVRPTVLDGGRLLCFDLRDYGIDRLTYGKLANADPYFHVQVDVTAQGKTTRQPTHAPWVKDGCDELQRLLNTQVPILRADWFFSQAAVQKDRVAGYYDLLGLGKKEADFLKLIGANPGESKRLKMELAASVAVSTVTLHNRGIFRQQTLTGGHWQTLDFKTNTDRQNTARLLYGDTEPPRGDASEHYGVLPNRLFAYWLQDAQGNRQDTAPDDIASDSRSTSTDRRVHAMLSCVRCHQRGLQDVNDFARRLFSGPVQLVSPDYEKLKRLRQLYLSDLPGQIGEDNARYAGALAMANGLQPVENSRLVAWFWESYVDTPVDVAVAARELGCSVEHLLRCVKTYAGRGGVVDPVAAAFAQTPPLAIRREHYEEIYSLFQTIIGEPP